MMTESCLHDGRDVPHTHTFQLILFILVSDSLIFLPKVIQVLQFLLFFSYLPNTVKPKQENVENKFKKKKKKDKDFYIFFGQLYE